MSATGWSRQHAAEVVFVGTEHLNAWDGTTGPDVLGDDLQAQLDDVVDRLAAFSPTRVMVEVLPDRQTWLDDEVRAASAPEYSWSGDARNRNEVVQIGVRLAVRAGATIHAVDADNQLDWAGLEAVFAHDPSTDVTGISDEAADIVADDMATRAGRSFADALLAWADEPMRSLNDREYLDRFLLLGFEGGPEAPGVDLVASWWRRNLRTFAEMKARTEPGDRVVVVFGTGHVATLDRLARISGDFRVIPLAEVLGR